MVDREELEQTAGVAGSRLSGAASATGYLYRRMRGIEEAKATGGYATGNEHGRDAGKVGGWKRNATRTLTHSAI